MNEELFRDCLYFTSNKLARIITKMAEEEFATVGISPAFAPVLMAINHSEGASQNELALRVHLTPSTVTRFIDKLEAKGLAARRVEGKNSFITPTEKGSSLQKEIEQAWIRLYHRYSKYLGYEEGEQLTELIYQAGKRLEKEI